MLWKFKCFCTKEWAKTPTCYLYKTDQHLHANVQVTAAKGGHTRYWKQRCTYFCNTQIWKTWSFFSINKWQRLCLIRFSLSTFRTYMKIWWCFDKLSSSTVCMCVRACVLCVCVCACVCVYTDIKDDAEQCGILWDSGQKSPAKYQLHSDSNNEHKL